MKRIVATVAGAGLGLAGAAVARAVPVTVNYAGTVQTVSGTPFGFDSSIRLATVTGSFTYETSTPDTSPADPQRGNYPHAAGGGAFSAAVGGKTITGSSTPFAQVENLNPDTFRYEDGPANGGGVLSVNGTPSPTAGLFIAFTDGSGGAFADDKLPASFPFAKPPLANPAPTFPHTFSLSDSGGTLLLQLNSISQVPEPGAAGAVVAGGLLLIRRRRGAVAQGESRDRVHTEG